MNEPIDHFKGIGSSQSPYYIPERCQCSLCGAPTNVEMVTQVSKYQHACPPCAIVISRYNPDKQEQ